MPSAYENRLAKLEANLEARSLAPALVLMRLDDADVRLEQFRAEHGCDPGIVIYVTAPEWPESGGPSFTSSTDAPCVVLPHNGRDSLPE